MWRVQSLQQRGASAARAGTIDLVAPVQARAGFDLDAPAALVWEVLTDIQTWPQFVPGVTRVRATGAGRLLPGARFTWVNAGVPIRSRVEVATPDAELTWTGVALWLVAVHRNTLEKRPGGGCRLVSSESMAGLGVERLMPAHKLEAQLEAFVRAIGDEARRRCE